MVDICIFSVGLFFFFDFFPIYFVSFYWIVNLLFFCRYFLCSQISFFFVHRCFRRFVRSFIYEALETTCIKKQIVPCTYKIAYWLSCAYKILSCTYKVAEMLSCTYKIVFCTYKITNMLSCTYTVLSWKYKIKILYADFFYCMSFPERCIYMLVHFAFFVCWFFSFFIDFIIFTRFFAFLFMQFCVFCSLFFSSRFFCSSILFFQW